MTWGTGALNTIHPPVLYRRLSSTTHQRVQRVKRRHCHHCSTRRPTSRVALGACSPWSEKRSAPPVRSQTHHQASTIGRCRSIQPCPRAAHKDRYGLRRTSGRASRRTPKSQRRSPLQHPMIHGSPLLHRSPRSRHHRPRRHRSGNQRGARQPSTTPASPGRRHRLHPADIRSSSRRRLPSRLCLRRAGTWDPRQLLRQESRHLEPQRRTQDRATRVDRPIRTVSVHRRCGGQAASHRSSSGSRQIPTRQAFPLPLQPRFRRRTQVHLSRVRAQRQYLPSAARPLSRA
ncbi:hypothetical protein E3G45_005006 [Mycobacteroides abscessus]|nr:hypothetical protein [Mycobacteroides abscessus]